MSHEFNLPGSSFDEVQKIIKGYSNVSDKASLGDISKLTGLHTTIVSRNNKFLSDIGLITGGAKKGATELGKKLGRALEHAQTEDCRRYWKEAVQTNEKVSGLVTTVRIKGGMSESQFIDHALYVSGQKKNAGNKTGSRCMVEVLVVAGLLQEVDGMLSVAAPSKEAEEIEPDSKYEEDTPPTIRPPSVTPPKQTPELNDIKENVLPNVSGVPQIAINIQLHLPETENAEVYEKLFKALKENLLSPNG